MPMEKSMEPNNYPYKDRKYRIVPYDPSWPGLFDNYASEIKKIFGDVRVEHIGSTAVPGMAGKSCIDVLVIIEDLRLVENYVSSMEEAGFKYSGELVMKDSRLFRVMKGNELLANVHFFPVGHPHNKEMLDLRDYFRAHPEEVATYSSVKNDLYTRFSNDYASYRKYKDEYMDNLKKKIA